MRWLLSILFLLAVVVTVLLLLPAPIDPVAWTPDPNPGFTGPYTPNDNLADPALLLEGVGEGPEDVACGAQGSIYTGYKDGRIVHRVADGTHRELTNTGGRPLGMQLNAAGQLIVADAMRGLLSVAPSGEVTVLSDEVNGARMRFVDDLDIAADGTVWFSDASSRHGYGSDMYDLFEARPSGRLLSYDPATGETKVHITGLFFANGVALGPNDDYVLVNETGRGRINRLWLQGPKSGQQDMFKSELPATPDNLSFNGRDIFWVAFPGARDALDALAGQPWLRRILSLLPYETLSAGAPPFTMVLGLDLEGNVLHNLQDSNADFHMITSANECDGALHIGSLVMPAVARHPL